MCRAAKSALEADRSQAIIGSMRNHHDDIGSLESGLHSGRIRLVARDVVAATLLTLAAAVFIITTWPASAPEPDRVRIDQAAEAFN